MNVNQNAKQIFVVPSTHESSNSNIYAFTMLMLNEANKINNF